MAIEYITQTNASSNTHGSRLIQAARSLRTVRDDMRALKGIMDAMVDDPANPTLFTTLETAFGLQAGDGTKLFTLVKAAFADIDRADVSKFTNRVG